ncbi:helix-turn-helix transcriptional regulator [Paenibacillus sp. P25]|nr:helix-turn-helix transcriptional regulator [Paenibacillus sp. P25]
MIKERSPSRYRTLLERSAAYYKMRILQAPRDGSASWEIGELFWYIGNATIRWILSPSAKGQYYWESLTEANVTEGESYIQRRFAEARPLKRTEIDPVSNRTIEHEMDVHFEVSKLHSLHLRSFLRIEHEIVRSLRTSEGEIVGLAAIYPIHSGTIPFLLDDPLASPYFSDRSSSELQQFLVPFHRPAGWFIRIIDIADSEDPSLTMEAISLLFSFMISGGLLITSPPPHPLFIQPHLDMGFQEVAGVKHCFYDGTTLTSTYVLDTRGNKLDQLLEGLLQKSGMNGTPPEVPETPTNPSVTPQPQEPDLPDVLSKREKEITRQVLQGQSNAEIAATLYISEVTVKKHLHSVYEKLQVGNRNQLLRYLLSK